MKKIFLSIAVIAMIFHLGACENLLREGSVDFSGWTDPGETEPKPDPNDKYLPDPGPSPGIPGKGPGYTFNHPCMLHTEADFEYIKARLADGEQPWKGAFDRFSKNYVLNITSSANASDPVPIVYRAESGKSDNYTGMMRDAAATYQLALKWKLEGDNDLADAAVRILNAWVGTCTSISDFGTASMEKYLISGFYGYQFANAGELLRDYEGWADADFDKFKQWMKDVFLKRAKDDLLDTKAANRNGGVFGLWPSWWIPNITTILAIGILCDDAALVDLAIYDWFLYEEADNKTYGTFKNCIVDDTLEYEGVPFAQPVEAGRDQGHCCISVPIFASLCQMAYNVGIDLWAYDDNKMLKMFEYIARYNLDATENLPDYPFTTFKPGEADTFTKVSPDYRGDQRPGWDLACSYYIQRGIAAPSSEAFAKKMRPDGGGGHYGAGSGGFDQLGFSTLMFYKGLPTE